MVRAMVSETTWNSRFLRSRKRNQTTTSRKLSTTTKSARNLVLSQLYIFFYRVAESEFRTQPIATDVSATGGADTIPTQTHANEHFFSYMHHSAWSAHFQCGNTALAEGEKEFVSRVRLHSFPSRLICRCWTSRPVLSSPTCPTSQTSATSTSFSGRRNNPCASARLSGMSGRMAREDPAAASKPQLAEFPLFF